MAGVAALPDSRGAQSVRSHKDRQTEVGQVVQGLIDADQGPEPGMMVFLRHPEMRRDAALAEIDRYVNDEIDHGHEPEARCDGEDHGQDNGEVDTAMSE